MPDPKGFPKIRGTILGVPNIKDHSILGSMLGSPCCGKLPLHITRGPPEVALQHTAPRRHSKAALQGFLRQPCASDGLLENLKSLGLARRRGKQQRREIQVSVAVLS